MKNKILLAKSAIGAGAIALACLLLLHFISPEFEPDWRMVSEYALGEYKFVVSIFFVSWGLSAVLLASLLWSLISNKKAKGGVILLFVSGIGATLASVFDVSQTAGHGFAGLLGIPTVPVAALLISYHLAKKAAWDPFAKPVKLLTHLTWISLALLVGAMFHLISVFEGAGIPMGPDAPVPDSLPGGAIVFVGYVNRLLIVVDILWVIIVARSFINICHRRTAAFESVPQ